MDTLAVILEEPERLSLARVDLAEPGEEDVVVDIEWSGISTGTERLLYTGRMPPFPGMGYPLIPGYEFVGRIAVAGPRSGARPAAYSFPARAVSARCGVFLAGRRLGLFCPAHARFRSTRRLASAASFWRWRRPAIMQWTRKQGSNPTSSWDTASSAA